MFSKNNGRELRLVEYMRGNLDLSRQLARLKAHKSVAREGKKEEIQNIIESIRGRMALFDMIINELERELSPELQRLNKLGAPVCPGKFNFWAEICQRCLIRHGTRRCPNETKKDLK
jgi:hypothetical protein